MSRINVRNARLDFAAVALSILFTIAAGIAQGAPTPREWTVLIYMNGKNSLEDDALNNFYAMASVGSSKDVAYVAELGRPKVHYTAADQDWSGVYRFYVAKGSKPWPAEAVDSPAKRHESDDMGRPAALESFVRWGVSAYPAKHYMLVIWNHGQGYRLQLRSADSRTASVATRAAPSGDRSAKPVKSASTGGIGGNGVLGGVRAVSSDDDTGSILYNSEVQGVVAETFRTQKLDVLGFDACLMAMIETAYAFEPNTELMVGSEEVEPGDGWQYAIWMGQLSDRPHSTPEELGRSVVEAYRTHYGDTGLTTLSLLNLQGVHGAADRLSAFADAVRKAGTSEIKTLLSARLRVGSYAGGEIPPWRTSVDLITVLKKYEAATKNSTLRVQSQAVRAAFAPLILDNYASSRGTDSGDVAVLPYGSEGLAIYFPEDKSAFDMDKFRGGYLKSNTDRPIAFVQQQTWADFLYVALGIVTH